MRLDGLRTVIYPTSDLAGSSAWWASLLGHDPSFDEPFYVGFDVDGDELGLLPDGHVADVAQVYLGVDDVPSAIDAAVGLGATLHTPACEVGSGIVTALVNSPDGAIVGFIFNLNAPS